MAADLAQRMVKNEWIPSLDGFRAIAILLVFLGHAGLERIVPGGFGVTVFFFLSGYLITTLLRREFSRTGSIDLRAFYLRRILRIWPAFYVVLVVGIVLTLLHIVPGELQSVPVVAQLLHFFNYYAIEHGPFGVTAGTGVFWSLAVEEHFYLAFPTVFLVLQRLPARRQALVMLTLCAVVLAWRCVLVMQLGAPTDRTYYATDTRIDSLLFGCALAVVGNPVLDGPPRNERLLRYCLVPLGFTLLVATMLYRTEAFRETLRYTLQGLALWPIFTAAIAFPSWPLFRVLNLKPVRLLGTISFSFYLVHFTTIQAVRMHAGELPSLAQGIVAFVLSVALAYAFYRLLERPLAALRRRLHHLPKMLSA